MHCRAHGKQRMNDRVIVFDALGTLVRIGERRSPYRKLMAWMSGNGRQPRPDDANRIMSQPLGLADVAKLFGMSPPLCCTRSGRSISLPRSGIFGISAGVGASCSKRGPD